MGNDGVTDCAWTKGYPSNYTSGTGCMLEIDAPWIEVVDFSTADERDFMSVYSLHRRFHGSQSPPDGQWHGSQWIAPIWWKAGGSGTSKGWKICAHESIPPTPSPTPPPPNTWEHISGLGCQIV